jgi:phosphoadenosine phosphosulfate reductase
MTSIDELTRALGQTPALDARLRMIAAADPGTLVFTTSFGLEDQVLLDAIVRAQLEVRLVTLDTGRLFGETIDLWAETERHYDVRIAAVSPVAAEVEALVAGDGPLGFRESMAARHGCCEVRKVRPLARALEGAGGWLTGLRADQSGARADVPFAARDPRGLIKFAPLADWSRADCEAYARTHAVPLNPLHARGFPSIGCAPCTRAILPGEDERAGRWWWEREVSRECGLHVDAAGRLVRAHA